MLPNKVCSKEAACQGGGRNRLRMSATAAYAARQRTVAAAKNGGALWVNEPQSDGRIQSSDAVSHVLRAGMPKQTLEIVPPESSAATIVDVQKRVALGRQEGEWCAERGH